MSNKGTILIVEDQKGFQRIYEDMLVQEGYQVLIAGDGEKGWELALKNKPTLILLDLGLPKMDGFQVLEKIRAEKETRDIPVVIFSVMGEDKEIQKAMKLGATDYAVKGFYTPRQVLSKIKDLLSGTERKEGANSHKVEIVQAGLGALKMKKEIGLSKETGCTQCGSDLILEMFPDYVRDGEHWYNGRMVCSKCGKAF